MSKPNFDDRNRNIKVSINGRLFYRHEASVNVFDSGFLHGKLFWSSPRLVKRRIFRLHDHLNKIRRSAELVGCPVIPSDDEFIGAIRAVLRSNHMEDGVHIRVIMTPGRQYTASMDLTCVTDFDGTPSPPSIVIIPEYRGPVYVGEGVTLVTSPFRRPGPMFANQHIHDNNQNHSSRACSAAKAAGATAGVMLDAEGFVAETHASHIALIKRGMLVTPTTRCCPEGVTRTVILELCREHGIDAAESDFTGDELGSADEAFIMGTMSGPVPALSLDGRPIGSGQPGPITTRLVELYNEALLNPAQSYDIFAR